MAKKKAGEQDLLSHVKQGYQLETDSLEGDPVPSIRTRSITRTRSLLASVAALTAASRKLSKHAICMGGLLRMADFLQHLGCWRESCRQRAGWSRAHAH
jgi:hypothetical protein